MLKQNLQLKLQQKLSPQQIQLMKLLQVTTMDLEQRIKEELQDNPALEEGNEDDNNEQDELDPTDQDDQDTDNEDLDINLEDYFDEDSPDYKTQVNNQGKDLEERQTPIGQGSSFQDLLYQQLHLLELNDEELMIADYLIGNLDDDGYLRRDLASIGNDLLFAQNLVTDVKQLEEALFQIQSLDPPGIGARNLQECLLIQLKRSEKKDENNRTAQIIVQKYFEEFTKKHFEKIALRLNQTLDDIKPAIDIILHLNPKPGNSGSESNKEVPHITPDFLLSNDNDELKLSLHGKNAPDLKISPQYKEMLSHYSKVGKKDKSQKEAVQFVKQKIDAAKWFIDAIHQRNQTLMVCMEAIIEHQRPFSLMVMNPS